MESCGFWARGHRGASCQRNIRRTGPAIVASSNGCGRTSWNASLSVLAEELHTRGKLEVEEAFIDASFTGAKKGASRSGLPSAARGRKSSLADDHRLPLAISIESASPHESQLVEGVLGQTFLDTLPAGLIGDKACDRDRWHRDLAQRYGIPMIALHIAGSAGSRLKMAVPCGATAGGGECSDLLLGFITSVGW